MPSKTEACKKKQQNAQIKTAVSALSKALTAPKITICSPPAKKAPVKKAPVKKAPVKKAPVKKAPLRKAVVCSPPVKKVPVKRAPLRKAVCSTPAKKPTVLCTKSRFIVVKKEIRELINNMKDMKKTLKAVTPPKKRAKKAPAKSVIQKTLEMVFPTGRTQGGSVVNLSPETEKFEW